MYTCSKVFSQGFCSKLYCSMCKGYSIAFNSKDILTSDFDDLCVSHSILCYTEIAYVLIYNEIYDEQNWFNTHYFEDLLSKAKDQPHTHPRFYIHLPAQRRLPREFQERSALYVHLLHFKLSPLLCLCISLRSSPLRLFLPASSLQKVLGNSVNNQVRRPFVEWGGRRQSRC